MFPDPDIATLQLVGKAGVISIDLIVDQIFRHDSQDLLAARERAFLSVERLLIKGYLDERNVTVELTEASNPSDLGVIIGKTLFTKVFSVTQKANSEFNIPLPPTLRENFVDHHIKTMEAIGKVELDLRLRGYKLVDWKTESELVRENFKGKIFDGRQQNIAAAFPDAVITVQSPDGATRDINIEYVSRKYTNEMIREKHAQFTGQTIWAAPNASTAARIAAITGTTPLLV